MSTEEHAEEPPFVSLLAALASGPPDVLEATLQAVDAAALCELKAASKAWRPDARRELFNRLCCREGQPEPTGAASITDLDAECLQEAGRPWEVAVAGRQLPQLARLHGFGFVVDLQAVQEADLGDLGDVGDAVLRSCIQGDGDPPRELLLAAVACAASGRVRRVPVQRLREDDAIGGLNLDGSVGGSNLGATEAALLGLMLPAATSVSTLSLADNMLCGVNKYGGGTYTSEGITKLCEALKGSAVTSLNLAGNQLCGLYKDDDGEIQGTYTTEGITKLCEGLKGSAVTSLNLRDNCLGPQGAAALAEGLKGNSTLQSLRIGCNEIGDEGASALAAILKETMISDLNIANNGLGAEGASTLAAILKETQIQQLKVDGHAFQIDELTGTKPVEKICLLGKRLGVSSAIIIASCIKGNGVLKELNLADNMLCGVKYGSGTYTAEGITKLCEALKGSAVTSLNLGGNQLCGVDGHGRGTYTTEGITKLCEALRGSAVTSLSIGYNRIGDEGASALAAILKETMISDLNIGRNDIGDEGASALAAILKETQITHFNISGNRLGPKGGAALAEGLKGNTSLQKLDLSWNKIGAKGASTLAAVLKETQIAELNLRNNDLGPKGGAALANGLKGNCTLQSLDLSWNKIGDEGASALAAVLNETQIIKLFVDGSALPIDELKGTEPSLKGTEPIKKIDLSRKGLGFTSAIIIASCIKENGVLEELNLGGNQLCGVDCRGLGTFTTEGITKLCEGLKGSAVTSLGLGKNQLCGVNIRGEGTYTTEGITKLCEGLKGSSVTSLDLSENRLGSEGGAALAEALKGNTTLQSLNLGDNQLCGVNWEGKGTYTAEGITKLCEALKWSAVTTLELSDNSIDGCYDDYGEFVATTEGIIALCKGLKGSAVTSLNLRLNHIGATGASALAAVLKETQIAELNLGGNNIRIDSAGAPAAPSDAGVLVYPGRVIRKFKRPSGRGRA